MRYQPMDFDAEREVRRSPDPDIDPGRHRKAVEGRVDLHGVESQLQIPFEFEGGGLPLVPRVTVARGPDPDFFCQR